jgi:5-methylcytosine-specific restriction endonuclease McrA
MTSGKSRVPPRLRERVARAADHRCGYCQTDQRITGYQLTIDHIVPESRGGETVEDNLWMACMLQSIQGRSTLRERSDDRKTLSIVQSATAEMESALQMERRWN